MSAERRADADLPSVDRAWELMEIAYQDGEVMVLGWADDGVMLTAQQGGDWHRLTFDVTKSLDRPSVQQEDHVLILAVRVPHPDEMSFDEVVSGVSGGSIEPKAAS